MSAHGPVVTAVLALLAAAPPGPPRAAAQAAAAAPAAAPAEAEVEEGRRLFMRDGCYSCHGTEAQGSPRTGPRLGPDPWPVAEFIRMCREPRAQMPAYGPEIVSDEELTRIWDFVSTRPRAPESIPLLEDTDSPQK